MPSAFATTLIEMVGPVDGYIHTDPISLDTATTLSTRFALVNKYEPWTMVTTKSMLSQHPVAVWRQLSAHIRSREGSYGRMVTLYCGWANHGASAPTTVRDMANLKGHFSKTFGGTGDPGMFSVSIPCPFDGTMTDVLKTPFNEGTRPVFYYCFTEVKLATEPPDAMRALIEFDGHFDVYGRY